MRECLSLLSASSGLPVSGRLTERHHVQESDRRRRRRRRRRRSVDEKDAKIEKNKEGRTRTDGVLSLSLLSPLGPTQTIAEERRRESATVVGGASLLSLSLPSALERAIAKRTADGEGREEKINMPFLRVCLF